MQTFWQWLARLRLLDESYFTFNPTQYDRLFDAELAQVIARTSDPAHRQALERMRGFNWLAYIAASVRAAGFRDQREVQERTHDVVVKLLTSKLFHGFDQRTSGPMDLRFKASVGNAIRNVVAPHAVRARGCGRIVQRHQSVQIRRVVAEVSVTVRVPWWVAESRE